MILFDKTDGTTQLSIMRSISAMLAIFFSGAGLYLLFNGKVNGAWMLLLASSSAFIAWDAHTAYKLARDPETQRKKLGY